MFIPNSALMTDELRIFRPDNTVETARAPLAIGRAESTFGLPGPVPVEAWVVLDHVVQIIHRITPWAVVYAVPTLVFEHCPDGYPCREVIRRKDYDKDYARAGGLSFNDEGIIALSLYNYGTNLISTAYHEAWHQLEKFLDKNILDEIDGHLIPISWGSGYLDSMIERRARCFETWCMRFEEGMPGLRLSSRVDEIFDAAATGEIGREWKRQQKSKRAANGR